MLCALPTRIHHIKGSKMKLKGCRNPGEWYIIPLCDYHHSPYSKNSVHENKRFFEGVWGQQKKLWQIIVERYQDEHDGEKPMSEEEYQIIKDRA